MHFGKLQVNLFIVEKVLGEHMQRMLEISKFLYCTLADILSKILGKLIKNISDLIYDHNLANDGFGDYFSFC